MDGKQFCEDLQNLCESCKKRGRTPRKIRFDSYCTCAMYLMKIKIDPTGGYHYPEEVLEYIRATAPGDIKGGIRKQEFCEAKTMKLLKLMQVMLIDIRKLTNYRMITQKQPLKPVLGNSYS